MYAYGNDDIAPSLLKEISESERLLVWSYRRWIAGMRSREEAHWKLVWREVNCIFDADSARSILGGLQSIIAGIGLHARRTLRLHPPCCGYICADELSFVTLIGACQRRDYRTARGIAEWLVQEEGMSGVLEGAGRIATVLSEHRLYLPDRSSRQNELNTIDAEASSESQEGLSDPALYEDPADFAERARDRL